MLVGGSSDRTARLHAGSSVVPFGVAPFVLFSSPRANAVARRNWSMRGDRASSVAGSLGDSAADENAEPNGAGEANGRNPTGVLVWAGGLSLGSQDLMNAWSNSSSLASGGLGARAGNPAAVNLDPPRVGSGVELAADWIGVSSRAWTGSTGTGSTVAGASGSADRPVGPAGFWITFVASSGAREPVGRPTPSWAAPQTAHDTCPAGTVDPQTSHPGAPLSVTAPFSIVASNDLPAVNALSFWRINTPRCVGLTVPHRCHSVRASTGSNNRTVSRYLSSLRPSA
jgi:hypothetical protein